MSTPTPPGHTQMPWPTPQPRKRGGARGLLIGAGVTLGILLAIGIVGTVAGDPEASTTTTAATTTPRPANARAEADCEAALRASIADPVEGDTDLPAACVSIGAENAEVILDRIARDYGIDATTPPAKPVASPPSAPKGVTVSGDHADVLVIRSFKAERDILGQFAVAIRLKNIGTADLEFVGVKVTALRGEEIIATADGIIETIASGQTITTEPISGDDFPSSTKGITYEVELGS